MPGTIDNQSATSKLGLPTNLIMSNARLGSGLSGLTASEMRPCIGGSAGVSGLLQLPGLLGGSQAVAGTNWEMMSQSSLACDLGGGRAHGLMVNMISPALHCLQQRRLSTANNSLTANSQSLKLPTSTLDTKNSNSSADKNAQSQIDIVHK